jgi:hypothetical protein
MTRIQLIEIHYHKTSINHSDKLEVKRLPQRFLVSETLVGHI